MNYRRKVSKMSLTRLNFDTDEDEAIQEIVKRSNNFQNEGDIMINDTMRCFPLPLTCTVSEKLLVAMRSIEQKAFRNLEFGIFLKGQFDQTTGLFNVSDEFYIPEQTVSAAAITFLEDPPDGFNGVIHRHPSGCKDFSGNPHTRNPSLSCDAGSINQNFYFSLLYVDFHITKGIININHDIRIQIPLEVRYRYRTTNEYDKYIHKIKQSGINYSNIDRIQTEIELPQSRSVSFNQVKKI